MWTALKFEFECLVLLRIIPECSGFDSWLGSRLSQFEFLMAFLSTAKQIMRQYVKNSTAVFFHAISKPVIHKYSQVDDT